MGYSEKVCDICGQEFTPRASNAKYCSSDCKREVDNERRRSTFKEKWGTENPILECRYCGKKFRPKNIWHTTYCSKDCNTLYWNNESDKQSEARRAYKYKKEFGITIEDYDKMFIEQGGRCAICGKHHSEIERKHFSVDHCHNTGIVRGLLCHKCNSGLGAFGDDINKLKLAVVYLTVKGE